jgi:pimeloyl-ACP methyl ester carboxylesterase
MLHVEIDGEPDRPPLLLVNGAFCTVRSWDRVVESLTPSFRVIRHDVRGTGRSDPGAESGNRFERYAADIEMICDRLEIAAADIWGAAWGARVALVAAATSGRFARCVLSDLAIDPADPVAQKDGANRAKTARAAAGVAELERPEGWNHHDDPDAAARAIAATRLHPDLMPFVEGLRIPTLIATGEFDPNLASSRRALGGLANGRLEVVPLTGHGSVLQRPDIMAALVVGFLGEEQAGRPG